MSQHRPEPAHGGGWNGHSQLGDIPFKEGSDEALAPSHTVSIGPGEEGPGKSSSYPESFPGIGSGLLEIESRELDKFHAACEGLGNILDNSGRCAAQYKKTASVFGAINQNAQDIEQFGHDLDLVKDDDSIQGAEHKLRILEALEVGLRLKVEVGGFFPFREHARESRLATLTGAKERGDWRALCSSCQLLDIRGSFYHALMIP
jgi:hypothetical protein